MIQPNFGKRELGIHQLVDVCLRAQFLTLVTVIMSHYYLLELKMKGGWDVEIIKIMELVPLFPARVHTSTS